mgnify:CR=1 FL=1|tara:strand:- start:175 stop:348 length:174 start_codon:yes stop_codon:yes gene_type:complete
MKLQIVTIAVGLILTASMAVSIVGTIYGVTSPSPGKYERLQGSSIYEAGFLFVCPFH